MTRCGGHSRSFSGNGLTIATLPGWNHGKPKQCGKTSFTRRQWPDDVRQSGVCAAYPTRRGGFILYIVGRNVYCGPECVRLIAFQEPHIKESGSIVEAINKFESFGCSFINSFKATGDGGVALAWSSEFGLLLHQFYGSR